MYSKHLRTQANEATDVQESFESQSTLTAINKLYYTMLTNIYIVCIDILLNILQM